MEKLLSFRVIVPFSDGYAKRKCAIMNGDLFKDALAVGHLLLSCIFTVDQLVQSGAGVSKQGYRLELKSNQIKTFGRSQTKANIKRFALCATAGIMIFW